nr:RNA-binding protein [uncultured Mediterraneibacter sp.]
MDYTYSYDYMYGQPAEGSVEVLGIILMFYAVIIGAVLLVKLVSYVIKGFAMYRMAQRAGLDYPWLAFVPFARVYLQGELSGDIMFRKRTIRDPGIWLILIPIIKTVIFGVISVITWVAVAGMIVTAVYTNHYTGSVFGIGVFVVLFVVAILAYQALISALKVLVNYQIYRRFTSNNLAIVHALLGVLVPLYESICLMVYRNKPYLDGEGSGSPEQQSAEASEVVESATEELSDSAGEE